MRLDNAAYAIVGEPGAGNVISGNNRAASTADGLYVTGGGRHRIQGNLIGTNSFGDPLGNYRRGDGLRRHERNPRRGNGTG